MLFANSKTDSLIALLNTSTNLNEKTKLLNVIGSELIFEDNRLALKYSIDARKHARQLNNKEELLKSEYSLGLIYNSLLQYDSAISLFNNSIQLAIELNDHTTLSKSYNSIGRTYYDVGDHELAKQYYSKAIQTEKEQDKILPITNLAIIYYNHSLYDQMLDTLFYALQLTKKWGNKMSEASIYTQLAFMYKKQADYNKAREYYHLALNVYQSLNHLGSIAGTFSNIGNTYFYESNHKDALAYYNKALSINEKMNNTKSLAITLNNIAECYKDSGLLNEALVFQNKSLNLRIKHKDSIGLVYSFTSIADIHFQLHQLIPAIEYYQKAIEIAQKFDLKPELIESLKGISEVFNSTGDFKNAYVYQKMLNDVKDSLSIQDKALLNDQLEKRIKLLQKEEEIEASLKERKIQKYRFLWLISVLVFLLVMTLGVLFYLRKQKEREKALLLIQQALLKADLKNTELEKSNLQAELSYKTKELLHLGTQILNKNDLLENLKKEIQNLKIDPAREVNGANRLKSIENLIHTSLSTDKERQEFIEYMNQLNEGFFFRLGQKYELTESEKRLCGLLKMKLSSKDIAAIENISPKSVDMARYRLRKKFNLPKEEELSDFLSSI